MQLVGIQIYNLDIARIKKQYKEMKAFIKLRVIKYQENVGLSTAYLAQCTWCKWLRKRVRELHPDR